MGLSSLKLGLTARKGGGRVRRRAAWGMAENTSQAYSNVIFSTSAMVNPLYFTSKVSRL